MKKYYINFKENLKNDYVNYVINVFLQASRFGNYYLLALTIEKEYYSIFSMILLSSNYLNNSNLGAINGMKKQIPLEQHFMTKEQINSSCSSVFYFNIFSTIFFAFIVSLLLFFTFDKFNLFIFLINIVNAFTVSCLFFFQSYYISKGEFSRLKQVQLLQTIVFCVLLATILLKDLNIYLIISCLFNFLLVIYFYKKESFTYSFDILIIKQHIKVGLPFMITGLLFLLYQSIDRIIITQAGDINLLAIYSFSWLVSSSLNLVTNLGSEFMLNRGANSYGVSKKHILLVKTLLKYNLNIVLVLLPLVISAILVIEYGIPVFLPKYNQAIPVIKYLLVVVFIQSFTLWISNYLYIMDKQKKVIILIIALIVFYLLCIIFVVSYFSHGYTDLIYAQLFLLVNIIYSFSLFFFVRKEIILIIKKLV